ncbi:MAG: tautomerase family protein [Desulfovibrionaceae bacterium]|nr:tautomerase family protein [Desulfovibrionaceae bacterium]
MPVITLELVPLPTEKKKALVSELTAAAARITGLPQQSFYVFIRENDPDNVGVGSELLSEIKARANAAR